MGHTIRTVFFLLLVYSLPNPARAQQGFENVYTANNKHWIASDTLQYYIMLKHNKTCLRCYPELYSFLQQHTAPGAVIGCLSLIDSSVFARKKEVRELNKLLASTPLILFDYFDATNQTGKNTSIFKKYDIDVTPALVIIKKGRVTFYSYRDIFEGSGIGLNPSKL